MLYLEYRKEVIMPTVDVFVIGFCVGGIVVSLIAIYILRKGE